MQQGVSAAAARMDDISCHTGDSGVSDYGNDHKNDVDKCVDMAVHSHQFQDSGRDRSEYIGYGQPHVNMDIAADPV